MSYKPEEEEKAKRNKRLLKAWGALLAAVTVAGGAGYGVGTVSAPAQTTQIEGESLLRLNQVHDQHPSGFSVTRAPELSAPG